MHQLLSASKYTNDGSEYLNVETRQDCMEYDTIDSPEGMNILKVYKSIRVK
jgi:hypothetical protein